MCSFRIMVPLKGENISSHAHTTGSQYLLDVLFKIFDKHPHSFYMEVPRGSLLPTFALIFSLIDTSECCIWSTDDFVYTQSSWKFFIQKC